MAKGTVSDEKTKPAARKPYTRKTDYGPHPPDPIPADTPRGKRTGNTVPEGAEISPASSSSHCTLEPNTRILGISNVRHTQIRSGSSIFGSEVSHSTLEGSHVCCGAKVSHSTLKNSIVCAGDVRHSKIEQSNVAYCDFAHCRITSSDLNGEVWTHEKVEGQISVSTPKANDVEEAVQENHTRETMAGLNIQHGELGVDGPNGFGPPPSYASSTGPSPYAQLLSGLPQ